MIPRLIINTPPISSSSMMTVVKPGSASPTKYKNSEYPENRTAQKRKSPPRKVTACSGNEENAVIATTANRKTLRNDQRDCVKRRFATEKVICFLRYPSQVIIPRKKVLRSRISSHASMTFLSKSLKSEEPYRLYPERRLNVR